jgi:periplasmic protein CpxP/Spy
MKTLVLSLVLTIFCATLGFAQGRKGGGGSPEERAEKQLAQLTQELGLTAEQQPRVKTALLARIAKTDGIRGGGGEKKDKLQDAKVAVDEYNASMKTILTPEQYTTLEELQKEKKGKMRDKMRERKRNG